jgi:hypothetical protein
MGFFPKCHVGKKNLMLTWHVGKKSHVEIFPCQHAIFFPTWRFEKIPCQHGAPFPDVYLGEKSRYTKKFTQFYYI